MADIKAPTITIEAKDDASKVFESTAKNIGESMKKAGDQVKMSMEQAKKKLSEYGTALGDGLKTAGKYSAGVIAGFAAMAVKSTKDLGALAEEIENLSKQTGISQQSIQVLRHVADTSGVSFDTMAGSIKKLQLNLINKDTKDLNETLGFLNLKFKDIANLSPEEQFFKIGNEIAKVEDPMQRTALAVELLGKSGTDTLAIFGEGSTTLQQYATEAKKMGTILSDDVLASAGKADKAFDDFDQTMKGLTMVIGSEVVPVVTKLVKQLTPLISQVAEWISKNPELISQIVQWGAGILAASTAIGTIVKIFESLKAVVSGLSILSTVLTTLTGISLLQFAGIGVLIAGLTWVVMNWDKVTNGLEEIAKWLGIIDQTSKESERSLKQLQQTSVRVGNEIGTKVSINPKYYGTAKTIMDPNYDQYQGITAESRGAVGKETISAGGGGILDSISRFWNGYADGGDPPMNKVSVVGENGPEAFIPKSMGTIIPNHALGGVTYVTNITGNTLLDQDAADKIFQMATRPFYLANKV